MSKQRKAWDTVLAVVMILLCLLFPELARQIVNPIVLTLFGQTTEVLSMSELTTMVIMAFSVLIVPAVMFLISRSTHREYVPIYMCGINEGDNTHYTGSLGEPRKLYLTNWYLRFQMGRRRLLKPAEIISASVLIVIFALLLGGVL